METGASTGGPGEQTASGQALRHPTEVVLAGYASGALGDGPSLTVSAHLDRCPSCRARVGLFEAVGGALLTDVPEAGLEEGALARALARIERTPASLRASAPVPLPPGGIVLPRALRRRTFGPRRWVAPGLWVAPVRSNAADGWRTYLLRMPRGGSVPQHGHNGPELTVVLEGAFVEDAIVHAAGDFAESGEGHEHHQAVHGDEACVCLISGRGGIRANGLLRLIQPFIGV